MNAIVDDPLRHMTLVADALDRSDDIVLVLELAAPGPDGLTIIDVNGAFCRMSAYRREDAIGRRFIMLASADGEADMRQKLTEALDGEGSLRTEMHCLDRAGVSFWFGLHLMPCAEDGRIRRFVVLGRDITAPRRAGEQQRLTNELLANVFISVDAAVAIVAGDGRFMMTNPSCDRAMLAAPGSLVGKASIDGIVPAQREAMQQAQMANRDHARPWTIDTRLLRGDASEIDARLTFAPLRLPGRHLYQVVTVAVNAAPSAAAPPEVQAAGKVQLVGLEAVRATLGDQWPALAERAMETAEHVIRRRLLPAETFSRTDDNGFVICFTGCTAEEAEFRAATIAREIRTRLIGHGDEPDVARVTAVAENVKLEPGTSREGGGFSAMLEARLNEKMVATLKAARETVEHAVQRAECAMEPVFGRTGRQVMAHWARLPMALNWRLENALSALPAAEARDFDLDALVLSLAVEKATQEMLNGVSALLMVAVRFEALATRPRLDRYLDLCGKIDQRLRNRLALLVSQLPSDIGASRLGQVAFRLRPFCRKVGFEVDTPEPPAVDLTMAAGPIVALNAERFNHGGDLSAPALRRLCTVLHTHRGHVLVRQVASREVAEDLRKLGVDMISLADDAASSPGA